MLKSAEVGYRLKNKQHSLSLMHSTFFSLKYIENNMPIAIISRTHYIAWLREYLVKAICHNFGESVVFSIMVGLFLQNKKPNLNHFSRDNRESLNEVSTKWCRIFKSSLKQCMSSEYHSTLFKIYIDHHQNKYLLMSFVLTSYSFIKFSFSRNMILSLPTRVPAFSLF